MLRIIAPGVATTIQDLGRPGYAHLGIPPAGVIDPALAGLLNRLVGNPPDAAVIETAGGLTVEAVLPVIVATSRHAAPHALRSGERVSIPPGGGRQWHYLVARGGFATPLVLGSRSHDTLSGLGATPMLSGVELPVGEESGEPIADIAPIGEVAEHAHIGPGPREDWFDGDPRRALTAQPLTITASSRIGVRLRGAHFVRRRAEELPSEGLVRGAIQVPPDGDSIMMLADHPTTGGYPVIAVVDADDVATVAQHLEGTTVRLRM